MKRFVTAVLLIVGSTLPVSAVRATDVDGPDDCQRTLRDFGDAPEGIEAYLGVLGRFPTCLLPGPIGTLDGVAVCPSDIPPPGPAGFVMHLSSGPGTTPNYWLGCSAGGGLPLGIDSEADGKVSSGAPTSACNANVTVDCIEAVGPLSFGQDECYGTNDAGIGALITLVPCGPANIPFRTYNCGPARQTFLNILIDYNQDGDWNDVLLCDGQCVYEWSVRNFILTMPNGCSSQTSPTFRVGPTPGRMWMRITISDNAALPDYPWNGSAGIAGQAFLFGETEDYPVQVGTPNPCEVGYEDFGDAPEAMAAYSNGIVGHFPTCLAPTPAGTANVFCPALNLGTPPTADAGYVKHVQPLTDPNGFWFGCNAAGPPPVFVDSESNGKVGPFGGPSRCDQTLPVDCSDSVTPGFTVGQDECYGDNIDAGIGARVAFPACSPSDVRFMAYSCASVSHDVFLNVLVDWNGDGDWNDAAACGPQQVCVSEWALKNVAIPLNPGCQLVTSPQFFAGAQIGAAWMRLTMTRNPVPDDFPWNGSAGTPSGFFDQGETEDYPVDIVQSSVGVETSAAPDGAWLALESPNPTASPVSVRFALSRTGRVALVAFDVAGRSVRKLASGEFSAGVHSTRWDLRDDNGAELRPGVYLVKLVAEDRVLTQRLILTK